jgi:hypothetical protein
LEPVGRGNVTCCFLIITFKIVLTVYKNSLLSLRIFMERVHISVHLTTPADIYALFLMSSMLQDHILVVLSQQPNNPHPRQSI